MGAGGGIRLNLDFGPCDCAVIIKNLTGTVTYHTSTGDYPGTVSVGSSTIYLNESNSYADTVTFTLPVDCGSIPLDGCTWAEIVITGDVYVCSGGQPIGCGAGATAVNFSASPPASVQTFTQSESVSGCKGYISTDVKDFIVGRYTVTVTNSSGTKCMSISGSPRIINRSGPAGCTACTIILTNTDCPGDSVFPVTKLAPGASTTCTVSVYMSCTGVPEHSCCDKAGGTMTWTFDLAVDYVCCDGSSGCGAPLTCAAC
jgi:hypothetical protein